MQLAEIEKIESAPNEQPAILVHSTYQAIKTAILGNRLRPGTKLTHRVLAEMFGVSRTPVRESLERLFQEGYVTRIANRGYFVAEIEIEEVDELYQTREALELYALDRLMDSGLSTKQLQSLKEINRRYKALCLENLSRERLLVDREFHLSVAQHAGNAYLHRTLGTIFDRLILKRRVEGFHDTRGIEPYSDHVKLLAAIAAGDRRTAQQVLRNHIKGACSRFIVYLDQTLVGERESR